MLLPFSQILSENENNQERLGKLRTERPKDIRLQTVHRLFSSLFSRLYFDPLRQRSILCFHCHAITNKNANQLIQKVQNKYKYAKSQAKNQVCAIIHMRDIRKNVLPKFIRLCMETPCWCPFEGSLSQPPAKCRVIQKPGNSRVFYRKTKNCLEPKICISKGF